MIYREVCFVAVDRVDPRAQITDLWHIYVRLVAD